MGAFADGIKASVKKQLEQLNARIITQSEEMFRKVVDYSPVNMTPYADKRGELKNNWWVGSGVGQYNRTYSSAFDENGTSSYNQAASLRDSREFLGKDGEVSFTNSVPYVLLAESVGWMPPQWRGTAPYAMVLKAMNDNAAKYKDRT